MINEKRFPVTVHMIVKNEERFVWYALNSILPFVEEVLIYDTGSTDNTLSILEKFQTQNSKIKIEKYSIQSPEEVGQLREKQIRETKTPWFLLVDGDEVWPQDQLVTLLAITEEDGGNIKKGKEEVYGVVNQTRNVVGDVWHYLPESFGKYNLLGKTGHFNIRLLKTKPYTVKNTYPDEGYLWQDQPITRLDPHLIFSEAWYLHASHLSRTSSQSTTFGRRHIIYSQGILMTKEELPEVFFQKKPSLVADVTTNRSSLFEAQAAVYDILRWGYQGLFPATQLSLTFGRLLTDLNTYYPVEEGKRNVLVIELELNHTSIPNSESLNLTKAVYAKEDEQAFFEKLPHQAFDIVVINDVLPRVHEPKVFINKCNRLVKKGGFILHSDVNWGVPHRGREGFINTSVWRLIRGIFNDLRLYFNFSNRRILNWKKSKGDWEPYLFSLMVLYESFGDKIVECISGWEGKEPNEPRWQIALRTWGKAEIFPFYYWGPRIWLVVQKSYDKTGQRLTIIHHIKPWLKAITWILIILLPFTPLLAAIFILSQRWIRKAWQKMTSSEKQIRPNA